MIHPYAPLAKKSKSRADIFLPLTPQGIAPAEFCSGYELLQYIVCLGPLPRSC